MTEFSKIPLAAPSWPEHDPPAVAGTEPAAHLCSSCEAVCCRLTVVLMPDDNVPAWMVAESMRGPTTMARAKDGWCVAMDRDSMCCSIYEERPEICRKFAMGGPYCLDERANWAAGTRRAIPRPTGR